MGLIEPGTMVFTENSPNIIRRPNTPEEYFTEAEAIRYDDKAIRWKWLDDKTIEVVSNDVTIIERFRRDKKANIPKGTLIERIDVHAGRNPISKKDGNDIDKIETAISLYREETESTPELWSHSVGVCQRMLYIDYNDNKKVKELKDVLIHWYEHPNVGAVGRDLGKDITFKQLLRGEGQGL